MDNSKSNTNILSNQAKCSLFFLILLIIGASLYNAFLNQEGLKTLSARLLSVSSEVNENCKQVESAIKLSQKLGINFGEQGLLKHGFTFIDLCVNPELAVTEENLDWVEAAELRKMDHRLFIANDGIRQRYIVDQPIMDKAQKTTGGFAISYIYTPKPVIDLLNKNIDGTVIPKQAKSDLHGRIQWVYKKEFGYILSVLP